MSKTTPVYARIDTKLKNEAETILEELGISASTAVQMLYSQIVLTRSFPLRARLQPEKKYDLGFEDRYSLRSKVEAGVRNIYFQFFTYTVEEVDDILEKGLGI